MPKYEIGYILSSGISDDEIPKATASISKDIEKAGANILGEDQWGRKKLAYPIGRTRNGYYVFLTANMEENYVQEVEHILRTTDAVIRFLILNLEEADRRKQKDATRAASRKKTAPAKEEKADADENVDIEAEIEKAISSDEKI